MLLSFCFRFGVCVASPGSRAKSWDRVLEAFVHDTWDTEESLSLAIRAIRSVQKRFRFSRRQLTYSWNVAWSWRMRQPVIRRPPLPERIFKAVIFMGLAMAATTPSTHQPGFYGGTLVFGAASSSSFARERWWHYTERTCTWRWT